MHSPNPYNYGHSPEGGVSFYSAIMYSCMAFSQVTVKSLSH